MKNRAIYASQQAAETEAFFDSLHSQAREASGNSVALDSARTSEVTRDLTASFGSSEVALPAGVQRVLDRMPEDKAAKVFDAVLIGMDVYKREHGVLPTADVIEAALQQGHSASFAIDQRGQILDNVGSTANHDAISAMPNRIVVAITSAIAEAIPFATYLPTDIGSNEAKLGIVSHQAGSLFGGYTVGEIMDGVNVGKEYLSAERRVTLTLNGGRDAATGGFTTTTGGATTMRVLRGRTMVFVNGYLAAAENTGVAASVANSPISGVVNIAGTDYTVGGSVTVATGAMSLTFSPALPSGTVVEAEGFIDYEADPTLAPEILAQVQSYSLFANPWRCRARQTIDSKTQYQNELGLDLQSEQLIAIRNQFAMERHYMGLVKLKSLAKNNTDTFNFDYSTQIAQKVRAQIWQDLMAVLGRVDQKMAEDTMDHGITHLYVGKMVAAQFLGLPRDIFEPSGVEARPGIYRLGRLFGRYEVYYTPKLITETSTASQILAVGRSQQVARCPLVLGDAVPATYMPLAFGDDMKFGSAFYARNFTSVNPHVPSAKGAALIDVTNIFGA